MNKQQLTMILESLKGTATFFDSSGHRIDVCEAMLRKERGLPVFTAHTGGEPCSTS